MERINFTYMFTDENGEERMISASKCDKNNEGIRDYEVCEMFEDFMRAVGFSENNVLKYFQE